MFIETLEFTIPVELCNVFSNLQRGQKSNVEFPASVNSYGTTQDANVQVVLRSNKLTFKVDGVSSNASMISKSECKTLKLSVFDVDHSLMPNEEEEQYSYNNDMPTVQHSISIPISNPAKRLHEQSVSLPPAKSSRTSYSESPRPRSPTQRRRSQPHISPRPSENSHSKSQNDTPVNVKQEPEDPDLIEIEPDDVVPKKETPYMQIDYSSDVPHTQTSQAALERLSHHQSSHSQSPASSSSSFHQNVPHVPDYSEPGPSHDQHGDQSADDFLVFQEQDENEDCDDNDVDYGNDGDTTSERKTIYKCSTCTRHFSSTDSFRNHFCMVCPHCGYFFNSKQAYDEHVCNRNNTRHECDKCRRQYSTSLYLAKHRCSYCSLCRTVLSTYQKYQQHVQKIHGVHKEQDQSSSVDDSFQDGLL